MAKGRLLNERDVEFFQYLWQRFGRNGTSPTTAQDVQGRVPPTKPDIPLASLCRQFVVKSVGDDHLVCRTWNGTDEGDTDVNVAKPYDLRRTPFDGVTFTDFRGSGESITVTYAGGRTRTLEHTDGDVTERIEPYWMGEQGAYSGDLIYATAHVVGGNDVTVSSADLAWVEVNDSGRRWIEVDWTGGTYTTLLGGETENETAQTDTYTRTQEFGVGMKFDVLMRVAYASSDTFYAFYREFTVDKNGKIRSVAAESKVTIFTTEVC